MFSLKSFDHKVRNRPLLENLVDPCAVKKFQAFYGNRIGITGLKRRSHSPHILSQTNPVLVLPLCLFKIHFNTILFAPRCFKWFVSFRLPITTLHAFIFSTTSATCPCHLILVDLIILTSGEEYKSWSFHLCTFLHSSVTFFLLRPNVSITIPFPVTLVLIYVTFSKKFFSFHFDSYWFLGPKHNTIIPVVVRI